MPALLVPVKTAVPTFRGSGLFAFYGSRRSIIMASTNFVSSPESASSGYRFPASRKVYTPGRLYPGLRVPHREITLSPTHIHNSD